ncbi:pyruvate kinase [Flammeovirgaceae bacterium SG7u.111]|nr:pyruvate kinase [Flammeovirgaceae bacterium SG7u.132]WPO33951.1 pyruvate kinase [Flammeovirgaceae bacterium SG7u.111]
MKIKEEKIRDMVARLEELRKSALEMEDRYSIVLARVHPNFKDSARNLLHYRALRQHDIRDLQIKLGNMSLSRLGKAESHVMASIEASIAILKNFISDKKHKPAKAHLSIKKGNKLLEKNALEIFGYRSKGRRVRIMVTQPSIAAQEPQLVQNMVKAGMNTARLNCAHDEPVVWKQIIDNIHEANKKTGKRCKISMDLGGPKIRTGSIKPGPKVVKFVPIRDEYGRVTHPGQVWVVPEGTEMPLEITDYLPVSEELYKSFLPGDILKLKDTRDRSRSFKIVGHGVYGIEALCHDTTYVEAGTPFEVARYGETVGQGTIGDVLPVELSLLLKIGDLLVLHKEQMLGEPAEYTEDGELLKVAHISCTSEEIFTSVEAGQPILFDDGKIEGVIEEQSSEALKVRITYAKENGSKLKADKGINFPKSNLKIRGLTEKDKEDLPFVVKHADVINMSFVNTAEDVQELIDEINRLDAMDKVGVILKIETQAGFLNLTDILITAMQVYPVGVMIARGDLAIECGWENMGRIQEEILSLCQAAHVPVIWATQVLESLAKKGIPSRAEITDASMAQRAECVMLNKGPHIVDAIEMLDHILTMMKDYQNKKSPMMPVMEK